MLRMLFTVDPFLDIGLFGHWFLFGHSNHPPPDFPPNFVARANPDAQTAYHLARAGPRGLFPKADSAAGTHITTTHKEAIKPSQWALKTLALNATVALTGHIQYAKVLLDKPKQTHRPEPPILGFPYSSNPRPRILNPLPHYLHITDTHS